MLTRTEEYREPAPDRRPLKIFAFDPMLGRRAENRITVDIANETLDTGPQGSRLQVIDYDGANDCFYTPVNLDDPAILMQNGLEPTESDPRFHQQMVYAVAAKVIENFEVALGRRIRFHRGQRLRLFPHAFQGANAFYHRGLLAVLFGYFRADAKNPGPNLPGQTVFTCLSHDIIAHEVTHALVDRLRRYFLEPTNWDVAAFHEGFSDIVAIFQHFSFPAVLRRMIAETRSDLRSPTPLITLAMEFGYATGGGQALRSALDPDAKPDPTLYEKLTEPHDRGSILVAAVFDAYFVTYQRRIADLVRIATGGTGRLPEGDLHPDLVNRIAGEAYRTAQSILTMCIRAFEYLPPVDITFGDYLRALVTADRALNPADEFGQRAAMIEAFRARGIYPRFVTSLAEDSLLWETPDHLPPLDLEGRLGPMLIRSVQAFSRPDLPYSSGSDWGASDAEYLVQSGYVDTGAEEDADLDDQVIAALREYAEANAPQLGLDPNRKISIQGFHPVFRVTPKGQLLPEIVAQFMQTDWSTKEELGGVPLRGGTTLVAAADGTIQYVISKPLPFAGASPLVERDGKARLERQRRFVREWDRSDPQLAWSGDAYRKTRIAASMNFANIHGGIGR